MEASLGTGWFGRDRVGDCALTLSTTAIPIPRGHARRETEPRPETLNL